MDSLAHFREAWRYLLQSRGTDCTTLQMKLCDRFRDVFGWKFDVFVGYPQGYSGLIYYVNVPHKKQILIYCPVVDKIINLCAASFEEKRLTSCQRFISQRLDNVEAKNQLTAFILKTDLKHTVSFLTRFESSSVMATQLVKEVIEHNYSNSFMKDSF